MSEKGWGKTVLGWFVVEDGASQREAPAAAPSGSADAADALIAKYAGAPEPPPPPPLELKGPLPPSVGGVIDFDQVFELGGVDAAERDRVTKARELLRSLPSETPIAVKKQIVEASLKAFGVPTEKIIEAAVQEMESLESFIRKGQAETQTILSEGALRIQELEAQIAQVKQVMQGAVTEQEARTSGANNKKLEVQEVLEFFGQEAVAKVVIESPKLHEPR